MNFLGMVRPGENSEQQSQAAAGERPPRLAEDRFYRALASSRRRRLLYHLLEREESTVEELVSVLSGWQVTTGATMHTRADRSRIRHQLLHSHLPRLRDVGLIDYEQDTGTVQLTSLHPRARDIIRRSVEAERSGNPE